jgi:histidyl-tRNA synthetase
MRDFLPEEVRRRDYVIGVIADVYRRYGFEPLETPAVENIDTLLGKYGEEGDRLIFKILKRGEDGRQTGESDLALRYDLTVPLARVVAEYRGKLPKFFKRYQVQPVWRADRPQKGRFREFYQCDVDVVGSRSMVVEADLCAAVSDVLERLGFTDFVIRLNDRRVLTMMLAAAGIPPDLHPTALVAIDKLDKIGRGGVEQDLRARGVAPASAQALSAFVESTTSSATVSDLKIWVDGKLIIGSANMRLLETLGAIANGAPLLAEQAPVTGSASSAGLSAVTDMQRIIELSASTSAGARLRLDPGLARGLSYYTGAIMEIAVPDLAGSLGGGGRYDGLIGMFLGEEVPACGFSLGLERILVVMAERGMFPADVQSAAAEVLVTQWNAERGADMLALASELRTGGCRVDVYPEPDKLGKQFKYAASRGIRYVLVIGDDEEARGEVSVKDMDTGEQRSVGRQDVAALLRGN